MVWVERRLAAAAAAAARPDPRRLAGAAAAVRRRHQADVQGGAAAEGRRCAPLRAGARSSRRPARLPRSRSCRSAPETTFFGLLPEPMRLQVADVNVAALVIFAIASMSVYGIVLAGWSSNSRVLAARRPAVVGADDQLRAVLRHGARERPARRQLAVADRASSTPRRARGSG